MKFDKFLLSTLWITALVLAADFWFDIRFGFNVFLREHWVFLADIQTGTESVNIWFYVSLLFFAIAAPIGLYYISKPHRRIQLQEPDKKTTESVINIIEHDKKIEATKEKTEVITTVSPSPMRPPSLVVPSHLKPITNPAEHISVPVHEPVPITTPKPPQPVIEMDLTEINSVLSAAGYTIKTPPRIDGNQMDIWATGTDEFLLVGKMGLDTETMESCKYKIEKLISETLDDSIDIKIYTFTDIESLRTWVASYPARPTRSDEVEDFDAYNEYIETVGNYFNKKS
ncbi:MAG: hypothetical protein FWC83_02760 [Alphaproteobacteria bacterium]|nr:hypothetical protein [Alphaproteobacteria bacterium]